MKEIMTAKEFNEMLKLGDSKVKYSKAPKYRNKKCEYKNIDFDSQKERDRYITLELLLKSGNIKDLKLQERYEIFEGYTYKGKKIQNICYLPDFVYTTKDGKVIAEDVKSEATKNDKVFMMKKKMFIKKYIVDKKIIDEFKEV